jgi:hypothetical protein
MHHSIVLPVIISTSVYLKLKKVKFLFDCQNKNVYYWSINKCQLMAHVCDFQ